MNELIIFLEKLEDAHISHSIYKTMADCISVSVVIPGERWEVDFFFENGETWKHNDVWVEKFKSDGTIYGKEELDILFADFRTD